MANQSGTVAPGVPPGTLQIEGTYWQQAAATLEIDLGGTDNSDPANAEYDLLAIDGLATLDGELTVLLVDLGGGLFAPGAGDTFEILTATDGITGKFESFSMPELADLFWLLKSDSASLTLSLTATPADFDGNSTVDGSDFFIWQRGFGTDSGASPSDGDSDGDGDVDDVDLANWQRHFGKQIVAYPANAVMAVPEPTSYVLGIVILCILVIRWPGSQGT